MGRRINKGSGKKSASRPKLPDVSINKAWIYVMCIAAILAVSLWLGNQAMRSAEVTDIRVSGNYFTGEEEIINALEIETGTPLDSLSYLEVIERVESVPYIRRADLDVSAAGRMRINVTERQPGALLAGGDMDSYVDEDGVRLPVITGKSKDVPLLYLPASEVRADSVSGDAFEVLSEFMAAVRSDMLTYNTISEIGYDREEGVVALSEENTVRLVFGHENFERRIKNWRGFYTEIIPEKGMQNMRRVDLRFENQVVTRER